MVGSFETEFYFEDNLVSFKCFGALDNSAIEHLLFCNDFNHPQKIFCDMMKSLQNDERFVAFFVQVP